MKLRGRCFTWAPVLSSLVRRALHVLVWLILVSVILNPPRISDAAESSDTRYREAAATYHRLKKQDASRPRQITGEWRILADRFLAIHRRKPAGLRGADALYSAALAHRQAWRGGGDWRDLSKATGTFREFTARYPRNRLADDSLMQMARLLARGYSDREGARHAYDRLLARYPQGDQAPAALRRLKELDRPTDVRPEVVRSDVARSNVARPNGKPSNVTGLSAKNAANAAPVRTRTVGIQSGTVQKTIVQASIAPTSTRRANITPTSTRRVKRGVGTLKQVQHWSALEWTRVILTMDLRVTYRYHQLAAQGASPARLYLDFNGAVPARNLASVTPVGDGVLHRIRIGRQGQRTTRVVLDLAQVEKSEVREFVLPGERKIIVDLYRPREQVRVLIAKEKRPGSKDRSKDRKKGQNIAHLPGTQPIGASNLVPPTMVITPTRTVPKANNTKNKVGSKDTIASNRHRAARAESSDSPRATNPHEEISLRLPLGLKVGAIMLDPGHGGHDPGAVGFGLKEKDVALDIAHRLQRIILRNRPEVKVGLTRSDDRFIPLTERPRLAKSFGADLFVSIHLNANTIERFHGVETYFLNLTNDASALKVAARENATTTKGVGDLNVILADLLRDTNMVESNTLAQTLQSSLVGSLRGRHATVRDLGVKQAPFLVLMGAEMPSVLVEAGFVTNRRENRRLRNNDYLKRIAEGFYDGLRQYMEQQELLASRFRTESVAQRQ